MSRGSSRGSALPLKRPRAVSSLTEAEPRVHSRPFGRGSVWPSSPSPHTLGPSALLPCLDAEGTVSYYMPEVPA